MHCIAQYCNGKVWYGMSLYCNGTVRYGMVQLGGIELLCYTCKGIANLCNS